MLRKTLRTLGICLALSSTALTAAPRAIIDASDITDDPIVTRDLVSGKAVKIEMNLGFLFDELADTSKGMKIDADGLAGVKPTCKELRTKLGLGFKATCFATVNNKDVEIGSDGEPKETCSSRQVPYQVTEQVCERICHGGEDRNGNCAEPDILCRNKTVTKYKTVTTCKHQEYDVHFDTTGTSTVDADTLRTHVVVSKVILNTDSTPDEQENFRGKLVNVDSAAYLQLKCADGTAIGTAFTDFKNDQPYTYKKIHQLCPNKKVYLQSNRALFFDVGTLNFYFDGYDQ